MKKSKATKRQILEKKELEQIDHKPVDFSEHKFDELNRYIEQRDKYIGGYYDTSLIDYILCNAGIFNLPNKFTTGKYSFRKVSEKYYELESILWKNQN